MEMKLSPFDPLAWFNIEPVRSTAGSIAHGNFYAVAQGYASVPNSWAYSLVAPEGLVASGGFMPIIPGVAEIWCATTGLAAGTDCGAAVARKMRQALDDCVDAFSLRRVQATIEHGDKRTARLVRALGLVEETKPEGLRGFLPDGKAVRIFGRWTSCS